MRNSTARCAATTCAACPPTAARSAAGHAFDPEALRRAKRERRDWSFEHSRQPLRAFVRTTLASLWPIHFWKALAAAHAIVPGRLRIWTWAWVVILAGGALATFAAASTYDWHALNASAASVAGGGPRTYTGYGYGSLTAFDHYSWPGALSRVWFVRRLHLMFAPLAMVAAWPIVAFGALQLFGLTFRRAGIGAGHLARCVLYPLPMLLLPAIAYVAGCCTLGWLTLYKWPWPGWLQVWVYDPVPEIVWQVGRILGLEPASVILLAITCVTSTFHLVAAHVRYLRLPHAAAQALLVQTVTWLACATALFLIADGFS